MSIIAKDSLGDGGQNLGWDALDQSVDMIQTLEPTTGENYALISDSNGLLRILKDLGSLTTKK